MKLSKFFAVAAATVGVNGECLNSWTENTSTNPSTCTPPSGMTSTFNCGASELSLTISPSHVFDEYTYIPTSILQTLKVQIQDETTNTWIDLVTFGADDTAQTQTVAYKTTAPAVTSDTDYVYFTYTLKVDSPSIVQDGHTLFTTRHADNFKVKCKMSRSFDISSSSTTITAPQLDAADDSEIVLDAPSLFTLETFSDSSYGTSATSFELGNTVYSRLAATMSGMPSPVKWDVNECTAEADGSTEVVPIFKSSGTCKNPYLNALLEPIDQLTGRDFSFRAFAFDDNTVDDQLILKCAIKMGANTDTVDNTDACVAPMA